MCIQILRKRENLRSTTPIAESSRTFQIDNSSEQLVVDFRPDPSLGNFTASQKSGKEIRRIKPLYGSVRGYRK